MALFLAGNEAEEKQQSSNFSKIVRKMILL